MRTVKVFNFGVYAGTLVEIEKGSSYHFVYDDNYGGAPISLTMPMIQKQFVYDTFPSFFEGLLPEGMLLESLIRLTKNDRNDFLSLLITTGKDLVGSVTVEEVK